MTTPSLIFAFALAGKILLGIAGGCFGLLLLRAALGSLAREKIAPKNGGKADETPGSRLGRMLDEAQKKNGETPAEEPRLPKGYEGYEPIRPHDLFVPSSIVEAVRAAAEAGWEIWKISPGPILRVFRRREGGSDVWNSYLPKTTRSPTDQYLLRPVGQPDEATLEKMKKARFEILSDGTFVYPPGKPVAAPEPAPPPTRKPSKPDPEKPN